MSGGDQGVTVLHALDGSDQCSIGVAHPGRCVYVDVGLTEPPETEEQADRANHDQHDPEPLPDFSRHSGYRGCQKCETVGAHQYAMVCQCCGLQQSRFDAPEESDAAYD
jgi:hypothetical protein